MDDNTAFVACMAIVLIAAVAPVIIILLKS